MSNARRVFVGALIAAGLLAMGACTGGGGQTSDCNRYIACVVKLGGSSASLDSKYGPEGTCWMDSAMAESCEKYCKSALAAFPGDAGC
jgi:hypothetical protein